MIKVADIATDYKADMTHTKDATWDCFFGTWTVYGSNNVRNATTPAITLNAGNTLLNGANYAAGGYGINNDTSYCGEISNRTTSLEHVVVGDYLRINPGQGTSENPQNLVFRWTTDSETPIDVCFDGFLQSTQNPFAQGGGRNWIDFSIVVDGETILDGFDLLTYMNAEKQSDNSYLLNFDGFVASVAKSIDFIVGNNGNYTSDVTAFNVRLFVDANAIPEPATWILLSLGVVGLGVCRRKKSPAF